MSPASSGSFTSRVSSGASSSSLALASARRAAYCSSFSWAACSFRRRSPMRSRSGFRPCSVFRRASSSWRNSVAAPSSASRWLASVLSRPWRAARACCNCCSVAPSLMDSLSWRRAAVSLAMRSTCSRATSRERPISSSFPAHSRSAKRDSCSSRESACSTVRCSRRAASRLWLSSIAASSLARSSSTTEVSRATSPSASWRRLRSVSSPVLISFRSASICAIRALVALHRLAQLDRFDLGGMRRLLQLLRLALRFGNGVPRCSARPDSAAVSVAAAIYASSSSQMHSGSSCSISRWRWMMPWVRA